MIPPRSVKLSWVVKSLAVKCQAMENTYSKYNPPPEIQYLYVMHQILHRGIKIHLNPSNLGSK